MKNILAADIGATNSRFGHFRVAEDGALELIEARHLATGEVASGADLLARLAAEQFSLPPAAADLAVLAVAGPVERGGRYSAPPYIAWDIDLTAPPLAGLLPRTVLLNDFVAQAYACRSPIGEAARAILPGQANPEGTIGVLGAGTGLGKAILAPLAGGGFLALPSEGGHACFPFVSREEYEFQEFYRQQSDLSQITGNLVVSGRGLAMLHHFLSGEQLEPAAVAARLVPDSPTLAWAARFYGRVCREFALEVLASGGLYIAGGVAAKNPTLLTHPEFRREFHHSPTLGRLLAAIPLFLIDNEDSGLWGAAFFGRQLLAGAKMNRA